MFEADIPRIGELLRSTCLLSASSTEVRIGESGGKASSAGLRGVRFLLGDLAGLAGRRGGGYNMRPVPSTPGIDRVRPMLGTVKLAADLDRVCVPDRGEVVRGLYGRDIAALSQEGELGDIGSVDLRT